MVANKTDLIPEEDHEMLDMIREWAENHGFVYMEMSAATNQGVRELMYRTWELLQELPPVLTYEPEFVAPEVEITEDDIQVTPVEDYFVISGAWVEQLMGSVNVDDYESRMYLDRRLSAAGVYDKLEELGIHEGDFVVIGDLEFEYIR